MAFPPDRSISAVPSWSWMAYTGGIDYFKLEFGKFDWALLSPPWTPGNTSINGVAIAAKAQKYEINTMRRICDTIVFDKAGGTHTEEALCVVLGIEKGAIPTARKTHYFLLVSASHGPDIKGLPTYHRIGAGFSQGWTFEDGGLEIALI
ncbi:hypothetical protein SLS60_005762 [Paraconiothyrium brasiliense]|uniref:Uncharacterized protein n=1 Tax=Paraconiothyrium brasiliense TaxID=300254 RepID=A0ABR3RD31_9PLEO